MKTYSKPVATANDVVSETLGSPAAITRIVESLHTTKFMNLGFGL